MAYLLTASYGMSSVALEGEMKFKMVMETDREVFETTVNNLLEEGWALYGSCSASVSETNEYYTTAFCQAMIKRPDYP
jgi:hypothetical protein